MNSWVRRSLQASVIAGGFVVLGAGVANAAEPGQAADLGHAGGIVGNVTGAAKGTVDQVTKQVPVAKTAKANRSAKVKKARKATVAPANGTVKSVTGEVTKAAGTALGTKPRVHEIRKVHHARTLPAPAKKANPAVGGSKVAHTADLPTGSVGKVLGGTQVAPTGALGNMLGAAQVAPVGSVGKVLNGTHAAPVGNVLGGAQATPVSGVLSGAQVAPTSQLGNVLGAAKGARTAGVPASVAGDVVPSLDVTDSGVVADVVGTVTGSVDETIPATVDLGDHGYVDTVTDVVGSLDGMTDLHADEHGLDGITSISGVLDTASTLTADVPGVASVFGYSSATATVDAVVQATGDLSQGDLAGFGAVTAALDSFNILDVDAGDLGYLTTTASVTGWLDAVGDLAANLQSGDVSGFLAATGQLDAVLTADGQLADVAGVDGVVDATAFVDGFLAATGNVYDGDLDVTGALFATLDATADGYGWVTGLGDVSLTSPASSVVVDKTLDLLEVDL